MRISDWSSDVCSSDLVLTHPGVTPEGMADLVRQAVRVVAIDLDAPMHFEETLDEGERPTSLQHEVQKISQMYDEERQKLDLVMKLQQARQVRVECRSKTLLLQSPQLQ